GRTTASRSTRVGAAGVLADRVEGGDEGVQRGGGVVAGEPDGLAVVRVAGAALGVVVLLLAFVDDGDAVGEQGEGEDVLGERQVAGRGGEAGLVVVLAEGAEEAGVGAVGLDAVDGVGEVGHGARGAGEGGEEGGISACAPCGQRDIRADASRFVRESLEGSSGSCGCAHVSRSWGSGCLL
ncbi:hypothetical protein Tdes44962_MAKER09113, partial [Teratosphaeria destructans]